MAAPPDRGGAPAGDAELRWRMAQSQLFGGLATAPETYEQVVTLVGATLAELRARTSTPEDVAAAAGGIDEVVATLAQDGGYELGALTALVGRAALATRLDELRLRGDAPAPDAD